MEVTLDVKGMSCAHCEKAVKDAVGDLAGIESVKVHLDKDEVEVSFDKATIQVDTIKEAIEDQGYDVK
ncbi:MAG TPA: copper chaperone CopZ [Pseudogracilibacillus sp.]|nr:copper chaperone CopZ [Pseudogracilibacillus sp.]